jgi:hypothetical protein
MTEPHRIFIQTRRPSRDGSDPGSVEEGFYIVVDGVVHMTNAVGTKLRGDSVRRPVEHHETAKEVAVRLLRTRIRRRPASPFNRPLGHRHYFNAGKI